MMLNNNFTFNNKCSKSNNTVSVTVQEAQLTAEKPHI